MTTPGKLTVGPGGRVTGPAVITHNVHWPCVNGRLGVTGAMQGVILHTMVGNLEGTIASFNDPNRQASAHFGVSQDGRIHQFGPLGKGWEAWHAMAANLTWYGIENADNGDTRNPYTGAQITATAQLAELLSRFAGFPLQVTDDIHGRGVGTHVMGGAAFGAHSCPGPGPRAGQRHAIIELAKAIRNPPPAPGPVPPIRTYRTVTTDGQVTLHDLAAPSGIGPAGILRLTAEHYGAFPQEVARWVNAVFAGAADPAAPVPGGLHLRVPVIP